MSDETTNLETLEVEDTAVPVEEAQPTETAPEVEEEVIVTFGEEEETQETPEEKAPAWVKKLRKDNRAKEKKIRELERQLEERNKPAVPVIGDKPTLAGCDFDDEKYEAELLSWNERKRRHESILAEENKQREEAEKAWKDRVAEYEQRKAAFAMPDFAEVEADVASALNQTQQGILVNYAKDPEKLVYALGRNEDKLAEVAKITDPIRFALALQQLESKVSITKRTPPPPEPKAPAASATHSMDAALARLEAEAEKTGNRTKLIAYKREHKLL